jgi:hypothetical protein
MKVLLTGAAGQLGAYTAVDMAESEPELALAVNGGAPPAAAEHRFCVQRPAGQPLPA